MLRVEVIDFATGKAIPVLQSRFNEATARVSRKQKRLLKTQRAQRREVNRKTWREFHTVELTETRRLLWKAIKLLQRKRIGLPADLAAALSAHEARKTARAEKRKKLINYMRNVVE